MENQGILPVTTDMPCAPSDIGVGHYMLPNTLQRAEREEAAARILSFSKELDQWVGVCWSRLVEQMQGDYELSKRLNEARQENQRREARFDQALLRYRFLAIITLGLYCLFADKPTLELIEANENMPFSTIFVFGPKMVINGIHELIDLGMIEQQDYQEGEEEDVVFFPTPALIEKIMLVQGVV